MEILKHSKYKMFLILLINILFLFFLLQYSTAESIDNYLLLDTYKEAKSEKKIKTVIHLQLKKYPDYPIEIMSTAIKAKPEYHKVIIETVLASVPPHTVESIATAFIKLMLTQMTSQVNNPDYVSKIIRTIIAAAPDHVDAVVSTAVSAAPEYIATIVESSIQTAPEQTATVVSAAVEEAPTFAAEVVQAAIAAAPDEVVAIVTAAAETAPKEVAKIAAAAVTARPDLTVDIVSAAVTVAPAFSSEIIQGALDAGAALNVLVDGFKPDSGLSPIDDTNDNANTISGDSILEGGWRPEDLTTSTPQPASLFQ